MARRTLVAAVSLILVSVVAASFDQTDIAIPTFVVGCFAAAWAATR